MKKIKVLYVMLASLATALDGLSQPVTSKSIILYTSPKSKMQNFPGDSLITNQADFQRFQTGCPVTLKQPIDFLTHMIWIRRCFADCLAVYHFGTITDPDRKVYTLVEYERDGGCSGMGVKEFIIKVPRPPEGYQLKKKFVRVQNEGIDK